MSIASNKPDSRLNQGEKPSTGGLVGWLTRRRTDYWKMVNASQDIAPLKQELQALREEMRALAAEVRQMNVQQHVNIRQAMHNFYGNLDSHACALSAQRSAALILDRMSMAKPIGNADVGFGYDLAASHALVEYSVKEVKARGGLYLEFGVHTGGTIRVIAAHADGPVHGFDSFIGLPEDWKWDGQKGAFDEGGRLPEVPANVELHAGWFNETLPGFLEKHTQKVSFINVDCDLYSSTVYVLDRLADRLQVGTVIHFDEYFKYQGWEQHEFKAWEEFTAKHAIQYEYLAYTATAYAVAVRITAIGAGA